MTDRLGQLRLSFFLQSLSPRGPSGSRAGNRAHEPRPVPGTASPIPIPGDVRACGGSCCASCRGSTWRKPPTRTPPSGRSSDRRFDLAIVRHPLPPDPSVPLVLKKRWPEHVLLLYAPVESEHTLAEALSTAGDAYFLEAGDSLPGLRAALRLTCGRPGFDRSVLPAERLRSLEWLAAIFRASPIGIGLGTTVDGRFFDVNDRLLEMLGRARGEVLGRTWTELGVEADPSTPRPTTWTGRPRARGAPGGGPLPDEELRGRAPGPPLDAAGPRRRHERAPLVARRPHRPAARRGPAGPPARERAPGAGRGRGRALAAAGEPRPPREPLPPARGRAGGGAARRRPRAARRDGPDPRQPEAPAGGRIAPGHRGGAVDPRGPARRGSAASPWTCGRRRSTTSGSFPRCSGTSSGTGRRPGCACDFRLRRPRGPLRPRGGDGRVPHRAGGPHERGPPRPRERGRRPPRGPARRPRAARSRTGASASSPRRRGPEARAASPACRSERACWEAGCRSTRPRDGGPGSWPSFPASPAPGAAD